MGGGKGKEAKQPGKMINTEEVTGSKKIREYDGEEKKEELGGKKDEK